MNRPLIFRSAHYNSNDEFICFTYWGFLNHKKEYDQDCFSSPASITSSVKRIEEQYVGMSDVNRQRIYEGDYLSKFGSEKWLVIFESGTFYGMNKYHGQFPIYAFAEYYIAGNKHENKE